MADGSIRVVTKLDNSQLKQQIKELERELKNIQKEQAKVDAQVDGVMAKYQAEREFDSQFPDEFSHREEIDQRAAKELDPIIAKQEELNQKERQYLAMLDAAKAKLAEQANIASASKQVDDTVKGDATMGKVQSQAQYNSLLDATAAKMAAIEAAAGQIAAQTGLTKEQILAANPQYQKLSDTMSVLQAKAADFGDEAQQAGKKTTKAMKQAEKSTKKVTSETRRGILGLGKMQLAMMGIMMATRAISAATREYMATNSKLEGQINTLKSLWGQVLGPAIEWVINLLIKAVSAVNAFVYALTGINFVARANEAALKKQAKAAGAAQGASFDEQTKLSDTSGSDNPVTLLDDSLDSIPAKLKELLEKGDFYGAGKSIAERLSKGIADFDWVGTGDKIGKVLGNAVGFVLGFALNLDPAAIIVAANGFVGGLLSGLADALQNVDWIDVGKNMLELFLWGLAMSNPATAILTILLSPNSDELLAGAAKFIGAILSAIFQTIVGSAARLGEIIAKLAIMTFEATRDLKWDGTAEEFIGSLLNAIGNALAGIGEWVKTNIWEPFRDSFVDSIDWDDPAMQVVVGLWEGIKKWFSDAKTWVHDNIWVPFRDGFKEAFDIHSPSGKMKEFGGDIISGLFQGITDGISKIRTACENIWSTIKSVFSSVGSWFQTTFSNAWQKVKDVFSTGGKIFDGIKDGIASTFKTIVNGLIDGINKVIRVPFNSINSMLNTIRGIEVLGVSPFKNLWSYNPLSIPQIPKLALGGIVNRPGRGVPAIIGEAGAEAVLPLENNTEWMDILADKIAGGTITIPVTLDGKRIATYIVDIQKKKAFAMNGA